MRAHGPRDRSAGSPPRRRHPARVYWLRRVVALTVLAAVVVGFVGLGRLLTGQSDGSGEEQAAATSAEPRGSEATSAEDPSDGAGPGSPAAAGARDPSAGAGAEGRTGGKTAKPPPAKPDGPCTDEDVVATPSVKKAVGGSPITIRVDLTTIESDACWWQVSPDTLTMRITSGKDEIWTSRQCPGAIPDRAVAVRREQRKRIRVTWSARRSDDDCTGLTEWALPGFYHVEAAAYAGEPREAQFEVTRPERPIVERTTGPEPKQQGQGRSGPRPQQGRSGG